jgi:hypothetical protein
MAADGWGCGLEDGEASGCVRWARVAPAWPLDRSARCACRAPHCARLRPPPPPPPRAQRPPRPTPSPCSTLPAPQLAAPSRLGELCWVVCACMHACMGRVGPAPCAQLLEATLGLDPLQPPIRGRSSEQAGAHPLGQLDTGPLTPPCPGPGSPALQAPACRLRQDWPRCVASGRHASARPHCAWGCACMDMRQPIACGCSRMSTSRSVWATDPCLPAHTSGTPLAPHPWDALPPRQA